MSLAAMPWRQHYKHCPSYYYYYYYTLVGYHITTVQLKIQDQLNCDRPTKLFVPFDTFAVGRIV